MVRAAAVAVVALLALTGCSGGADVTSGSPSVTPTLRSSEAPRGSVSATPSARASSSPPTWLGTRPLPLRPDGYGEVRRTPRALRHRALTLPDTLAKLPGRGFTSRVEPAPAAVLARSTWQPGCPVAAADLVSVFGRLYSARFPIEAMRITTRAELGAAPTGDGNVTESFVCRPTVGETTFSQHAYGLAVDVDPFQNPYTKGDLVIPELASSYLRREPARPGVITPDGVVVHAFASVGWTWGGTWSSLKDFQHFSRNGR